MMQITQDRGNRVTWLVNTSFETPDALWRALCATGAEALRDGDSIWASESALRDAELWQLEQSALEEVRWKMFFGR